MQKAVGFFLRLFPPDTKPLKPVSGAPRLSQRRPKGAPRPRGDGKGVGGGPPGRPCRAEQTSPPPGWVGGGGEEAR